MKKQFLEAGRIVGTHGVRGEMRVEPWCDSADFLKKVKTLYFDGGKTDAGVVSSRVHKGRLLLCEEKDRLTEEYGILRGGTDGIAPAAVCGRHTTPYGTEYLVRRSAVPAGMTLGQVNIEDLFVFMAKEV